MKGHMKKSINNERTSSCVKDGGRGKKVRLGARKNF